MRRFRTLNKLYAWLLGYFWIPCPMCDRMFGGHECSGSTVFIHGTNKVLCWRCPESVAFAVDGDAFVMIGYSYNGMMFVLDNNAS